MDADGVLDTYEYLALLEGEEVDEHDTDPSDPDTDGGGVNNGDEIDN